ncbi:MAG: hypothetical protein LIP18_05295 [Planctomycetes bacterium]|nr:hypothetical protein [Planctomycetota bacterium]MCD7896362.1 hypothetical protein [Planctomycetaceae bacterium]
MATSDLIIGLGHRKRVGKNTFAEMLEEELTERDYDVYQMAFAHDMKAIAHEMFGVYGLRDAFHYEVNPNHREQVLDGFPKTPRQLWIEFGNAVRNIAPDIWVDRVRNHIETITLYNKLNQRGPAAFIITDVRFPNEADAIRSWRGHLAVIHRCAAPIADDPAETALDRYHGWAWTVRNDRTFEYLAQQARNYVNFLTSPKG